MVLNGRRRAIFWPILVGILASLLRSVSSKTTRGHGRLVEDDKGDDRTLKGEEKKKKEKQMERSAGLLSCKADPLQPHCLPPTLSPTAFPSSSPSFGPTFSPSSSPTFSPSSSPSERCQTAPFISSSNSSTTVTRFSFTNEIDLTLDCSGGDPAYRDVERAFVLYQNELLELYGCPTDEIVYDSAAITSACVIEGGEEDCSKQAIADFCSRRRRDRRNLQTSSTGSANVRYKYNTLGNCRRQCADSSLPKEDDCVDCGGRLRRRAEGDDRSLLVDTLQSTDVNAEGADVISDSKNSCDIGGEDCCSADGRCCGVVKGCNCPTVSETLCMVTSCDLPGCCGPRSGAAQVFNTCPERHMTCFCSMALECDSEDACSELAVCSNIDHCPTR